MGRSVLIVDDHAGFRGWARALLEAEGFRVVGEAGDGEHHHHPPAADPPGNLEAIHVG
jgi:DNA-binding NarL/FixJ family response regulator